MENLHCIKCVEPRFLNLETFHPVVLTNNGDLGNCLELDLLKIMSLSPLLQEIILGLHFPLSWIEDVRVVVPDAENETLSSLQILLDTPSDVSVSNNQFDKLLDLINDLGFNYFPSVCVTTSDLIEEEHLYFKKIEDEVQGSDDEMVIDSDFYSGFEEYNNNEDVTFPEHINFENKLLNLGKIVLEKKNVEGNLKTKKKSRRVRCGNCSHCLLNKETPRCGECSHCLNPNWHKACKQRLYCLKFETHL